MVPFNALEIGKRFNNIESKFIILDKREVVRIILIIFQLILLIRFHHDRRRFSSRDFSINSIAFLFDQKCLFDPLMALKI